MPWILNQFSSFLHEMNEWFPHGIFFVFYKIVKSFQRDYEFIITFVRCFLGTSDDCAGLCNSTIGSGSKGSFWIRLNRYIIRLCSTHQFKNLQVNFITRDFRFICHIECSLFVFYFGMENLSLTFNRIEFGACRLKCCINDTSCE